MQKSSKMSSLDGDKMLKINNRNTAGCSISLVLNMKDVYNFQKARFINYET